MWRKIRQWVRHRLLYRLVKHNWEWPWHNPDSGKREIRWLDTSGNPIENKLPIKIDGYVLKTDDREKRKLLVRNGTTKLTFHHDMIKPFVDSDGMVGPQKKIMDKDGKLYLLICGPEEVIAQ